MATRIGYGNLIDSATLSGGSWDADFPLDNVKTRFLGQRARAAGTSVSFTVTLGGATAIGAVAVAGNLSPTATITVTCGAFNSGAIVGTAVAVPDVSASSVTIAISDAANPDGFIAIGRVFVGPAWKPATCTDWNRALGLVSATEVAESLNGVEFFNRRPVRRSWRGHWSWLTEQEAYDGIFAIQRSHDIADEVVLIDDDMATTYAGQRAFLGRFRQLSEIEYPYPMTHGAAVEVQELL